MVNKNFLNSLEKGMKVLESFSTIDHNLSIVEIAKKVNLQKSIVYRIVFTLKELGYLKYTSSNHKYFLGPKVLSLGFSTIRNMKISEIAHPYLRKLYKRSSQTIALGVLDGTEVVYIDRFQKEQILNINLHIGSRLPVYNSSIGRAILAFLPQDDYEVTLRKLLEDKNILSSIGKNGEKLAKILKDVRKVGYAIDDQEYVIGLRAIAAPIFGLEGKVRGAVNIPVLTACVSMKKLIEKYAPMLLETSREISTMIGYNVKA